MLLQMTVIDTRRGVERPVEVRAEPHHTLADLHEALSLPDGSVVHVGAETVLPGARVGLPPLLDGAVLLVGHEDRPVTKTTPRAPLRLTTVAGPDAGRSRALTLGRHVVGRSEAAAFHLDDHSLSREHLSLSVDRDGVLVHDLGTTNGTLVDDRPVPDHGVRVRAGSRLRAGHTTFVIEADRPRPSRRRATGSGTLAVNPVPHLPAHQRPVRIVNPPEPRAPARARIPWVMVLLPLPFAGFLAAFFGPRMLLFGLLTPLLAIASTLSDRSSSRREHREQLEAWTRERVRTGERLTKALAAERHQRLRAAPGAMTLLDAARGTSTRLWERRTGHAEHLGLRLGLAPLPAHVEVDRGDGVRSHPVLPQVPLVVGLDEVGVLGIAGERTDRDRLARHLLGQLTVLHSHHDVQLSVVAEDEGWWSPFATLVHLREHEDVPTSSRTAIDDTRALGLIAGHARTTRERAEERSAATAVESVATALVLVVDGIGRWRTDAGLRTVLTEGRANRVLVIALADTVEELPHECGAVVSLRGEEVSLQAAGTEAARGIVDGVGDAWAQRTAAALAPLRDATPDATGAGLPGSVRLIDLLDLDPDDAGAVRSAWTRTSDTHPLDLEVVVGEGSDGAVAIDLRRDGPHALVAGTTGSGKSEFLQSWVASLAVRLSPEEITFVLVDYKGGAAFAECARLPHTVGLLTDLDPEQAERALTSLDAELTRRERILAASGAKDIDDHRGAPLPRLMIVIDEFRMLAEEQPEALAHLMRIAAVGRSLGVHLVLATQRPGGIVSADIKANVNLRIALRVRDKVDSDDVIGSGAAVDIPEDAPGRTLARTGGSPARFFQTGRVAGRSAHDGERLLVRDPGSAWPALPSTATGPTDLQRLVATLTTVAAELAVPPPHRPWLPPLAQTVPAADLQRLPEGEGGAPFALVDRPDQQRQVPMAWTPADGHWMVVGGPGTGRTTSIAALVTAAARTWSPDRLQVQLVGDGSSRLSTLLDLPHVGSVIDGEDLAVTARFLARLRDEVTDRRARLRSSGHGSVEAWWAAHDAQPEGEAPPPYLLLGIDGWGRTTRPRGGTDLGETAEVLETLLRDGIAAGLRAFVTGGREMLSGRISSLVTTRLVLHLPDRGDATLAGLSASQAPARPIPGRAHRMPGAHVVQIALPATTPDETAGGAHPPLTDGRPWRVEPLPEHIGVDALPTPAPERIPLGVGGGGREPTVWRTGGARRLLVCGPPRSGRTTALATITRQSLAAGHPVALIGEDVAAHLDPVQRAACTLVAPEDRDALITLRREHPDLALVVDDAERIEDTPVADVVTEILRRVDTDRGLVVAATATQTASTRVRGLVAEIGRHRTGILLQPSSRSDGDALGLRVPPLPRLPGRGYLVTQGQAEEVQIAHHAHG